MIEILNGTRENVNYRNNTTVKLFDNTVEEDYPLHWHTPLEIIMPFDNIYTAYCNNAEYVLKEGEILIINSGVLHKLTAPAKGRCYIILADLSPLYNIHEVESLLSILSPVVYITASNSPKIHERLQRLIFNIAAEYESEAIFRETGIYSKLISALVLICRNQTVENSAFKITSSIQLENSKILLSVCDYINHHYNENLTLDQVADLAGFSKYHFSRIFRQYVDISFYQYLNKKRIMQATKLLMEPGMSIMEVSLQSGFSTISSFIRMFKILKGCTPSEFKDMYQLRK